MNFGQVLSENIWLAFVLALLAGVLSSFSPCVLSALPLVVGYVGGYAGKDKKMALRYSLLFCAGLVLTLTTLGAISAVFGVFMSGAAGRWWYLILAVMMMLVALQMFGVFEDEGQAAAVCTLPNRRRGLVGAFFMGILGGVLSSPCATPVLIAILAFVAERGSIVLGVSLLAVYSLGHCVLILLAGTSVGFVQKMSENPRTAKVGKVLKIIFGVLILMLAMHLFYIGF